MVAMPPWDPHRSPGLSSVQNVWGHTVSLTLGLSLSLSGVFWSAGCVGERALVTNDLTMAQNRQENEDGFCENTGSHPVA